MQKSKLFLLFIFLLGKIVWTQEIKNNEHDLHLENPVQFVAYYDVQSGKYIIFQRIGTIEVGTPVVMTPEQYSQFILKNKVQNYYKEKSKLIDEVAQGKKEDPLGNIIPQIPVKSKLFELIFGGNKIELIPSGYASVDLGILSQKIDNPALLPQNRQNFTIDLQQRIKMSVMGKLGENLKLQANYDTQSGFAFENRLNLQWKPGTIGGGEDNIIKNIEFGNVNLPLSTSLITGAQALFGLKTELQFGRTYITTVISEQQSEARNIAVQGNNLINNFKVNVLNYEENQHYFTAQYFRNHYDQALLNYPLIQSNIQITRMEVWKIDQSNQDLQNQRSIVALRDVGETTTATFPSNGNNSVYSSVTAISAIRDPNTAYASLQGVSLPNYTGANENYISGENFEFTKKARLLNSSEYTFDAKLGTISLSQSLPNDQILAVAFEYTINGSAQTYKVGEFANETNGVLVVKLLKSFSSVKTSSPMWDLMMKNIYSLDATQISKENFFLNVSYKDDIVTATNPAPSGGFLNYLPDPATNNQAFIKFLNWDRLNLNGDATSGAQGDGVFDWVEGITINSQYGKVMFTKVEPFGSYLSGLGVQQEYVFQDLYDKTKQDAQQSRLSEKYYLEGRFSGTQGSGIPLGALNVPRGSVKVTANGQELVEGVDYIVDYQLGRVNIINETVKNSGVPINISLENQSTFNLQRKRFIGMNIDHIFNEKLRLGLTAINYQERPLTQKAQYGVEPVNNSMFGFNLQYNTEAPILTKIANLIPGIKTEAKSNFNLTTEAAYLLPGTNNAIENQSYIDDFEETASRISLKDPSMWQLSSSDALVLPPSSSNALYKGFGRGLISWYNIDPRFYGVSGSAPDGIDQNALSHHLVRRVKVDEVYTNRDFIAGEQLYMNTFDLTFYPNFKGPYNNDTTPIFSNDVTTNQQRWGGLMRSLTVTNFQQANIESVEFWVMDPYADQGTSPDNFLGDDPKLYIHLGNISEDVNNDGKQLYENGLPSLTATNPISDTDWGKYPTNFPLIYTFESEGNNRRIQDAGYDGILSSAFENVSGQTENTVYNNNSGTNPFTTMTGTSDPALDDFLFYNSDLFTGTDASDIRQRYRYFRNPEGNSPSGTNEAATAVPDAEDTNRDYNLDLSDTYNQYTFSLKKSDLVVGSNYVIDQKTSDVTFENGQTSTVKWYLVRIPLRDFDNANGDLSILNNVRYVRMFMKGFKTTSTLRFASLDLVRTDWRIYSKYIHPGSLEGDTDTSFNTDNVTIGAVDYETNGAAQPPYMLPPGIVREELQSQGGIQSQNESSMYMRIDDLIGRGENAARGVFKNIQLDMRRYKNLKFFVSAQNPQQPASNLYDNTMKFFIRFGSDASDNYYEYEFSLKYTPNTATSIYEIWPEENTVDFNLDWFVEAKKMRDLANFALQDRYNLFETGDVNKKVYIKGRPSLGNVTTIVLGARSYDFLNSRDVILWVNELRLSGMDNEGGYAANTNLSFNLGDLMQVDATGSYKSVGFGAINETPSERSQEEIIQYNVNTSVNLDKFMPEKWGIKLPFQYSTGEQFINPKYNPLDNDVLLNESPNREKINDIVRDYTQNKTIAFPSIRKERKGSKKPRFYDVENLTLSFLYSDIYHRDIYTKYNISQNLRASLDYNYNFKPYYIEPFKKLKYVQDSMKISKYLQWLKEVNFNPVPSKFSFRTEMMRTYNEFQFRDINSLLNGVENNFSSVFTNNFIFGWQYNLGFNLTKNLKLDINSATRTLVDDIGNNLPNQQLIWQDLTRVGRPINYYHDIQLNYRLPLQFFPYLDFATAEIGYKAKYDWTARSTAVTATENLGNLAQNTQGITVNGNLDFVTLYYKFKGYNHYDSIKIGRQREIDSLSRAYEANMKLKRPKKFKSYKFKHKYKTMDYAWMILSSLKRGQITYTETNGTSLPGFLGEPEFFGYSKLGNSTIAPTFGFLFGSQSDIRQQAFQENWITRSEYLLEPYFQTSTKNITGNIQIEPTKDLKIDLNFLRNEQTSLSQSGYNTENTATNFVGYRDAFVNEMASFNSSIISFKTAFANSDEVYNSILDNSKIISQRIALQNGAALTDADADGYIDGYNLSNSEVIIPSFYSAITGENAQSTKLGYKRGFPLPNWDITYSGLKNVPWFNSKFETIELQHSYLSSYTVNGIQSNLNYYNDPVGLDLNQNRYNYYSYNSVSVQESFSPLIGVEATLRNNMQIRAQYNRDRSMILSLNNATLQEDFVKEYVIGFGYIIKDVKLKLRYQGKVKNVKSDLNIRADFSLKDNETRLRRIIQDDVQITGGQNIFSLKVSADYNFSKYLNLKLFYDHQFSQYKISTAYPLTLIRAGISATFQFGK